MTKRGRVSSNFELFPWAGQGKRFDKLIVAYKPISFARNPTGARQAVRVSKEIQEAVREFSPNEKMSFPAEMIS
jgi:hypothetical protein